MRAASCSASASGLRHSGTLSRFLWSVSSAQNAMNSDSHLQDCFMGVLARKGQETGVGHGRGISHLEVGDVEPEVDVELGEAAMAGDRHAPDSSRVRSRFLYSRQEHTKEPGRRLVARARVMTAVVCRAWRRRCSVVLARASSTMMRMLSSPQNWTGSRWRSSLNSATTGELNRVIRTRFWVRLPGRSLFGPFLCPVPSS